MRKTLTDRIYAKIAPANADGCRLWTARFTRHGECRIWVDNERGLQDARPIIYEHETGERLARRGMRRRFLGHCEHDARCVEPSHQSVLREKSKRRRTMSAPDNGWRWLGRSGASAQRMGDELTC